MTKTLLSPSSWQRRVVIFVLAAACFVGAWQSAWSQQNFDERGKVDFDVFLDLLAPHGQWEKVKGVGWCWRPQAAQDPAWRPYTTGRWTYTDFGWVMDSPEPFAAICNHFGYWQNVGGWTWRPGHRWAACTVEWRGSGSEIGWRPARRDRKGEFDELPDATVQRTSDWCFMPASQLLDALKPSLFLSPAQVEQALTDSSVVQHVRSIPNYREFTRPGPNPEEAASIAQHKPLLPLIITSRPSLSTIPDVPEPASKFFVFRPQLFQDEDGILRRIAIWHEKKRGEGKINMTEIAQTIEEEAIQNRVQELRKKKAQEGDRPTLPPPP